MSIIQLIEQHLQDSQKNGTFYVEKYENEMFIVIDNDNQLKIDGKDWTIEMWIIIIVVDFNGWEAQLVLFAGFATFSALLQFFSPGFPFFRNRWSEWWKIVNINIEIYIVNLFFLLWGVGVSLLNFLGVVEKAQSSKLWKFHGIWRIYLNF